VRHAPAARLTDQVRPLTLDPEEDPRPVPTYDYVCTACGHRMEVVHGIDGHGPDTCPVCGSPMRKAFAAPAVHFKGSGWAKKDRGAASSTRAAAKAAGGEGGSTSAKDGSGPDGGGSSSGDKSSSDKGSGDKGSGDKGSGERATRDKGSDDKGSNGRPVKDAGSGATSGTD
jgi:putative FmdB family regulatory protein